MFSQNTTQLTAGAPRQAEARPTTFTRSPGAEEPAEPNFSYTRNAAKTAAPEHTKHILVIDDDPAVRELVVRTVAQAGFRADTAQDGEEGWRALCLTGYDLVITDNEMPRLTGIKLIKRLRAVSIEPPCILITGCPPESEITLREIVHPGVVLTKPFSSAALIEKVYLLLLHGEFQGL